MITHDLPALALPAEFYTAADAVARDRSAVFARGWQLLTYAAAVPNVGDNIAIEIAGLPVVLLRDQQGELRAFHNVCRHRAGPLAVGKTCAAKRLRCRYHGWSYGLDGQLQSAPEMDNVADFDPASIRLPGLQLEVWQGLVFVSENPQVPLAQVMDGIASRIGYPLHNYVFACQQTFEVACDWKVYVDNYLEGYHVPHIHPELNRLLDYRSYVTTLADWHSLQFSPLETGNTLYGSGEALYYFVYPNTMLNILPGRLQTNRVLPLGAGRCRVEFDYYYSAQALSDSGKQAADLDFSAEVQEEDRWICEAVQRGLASGSYLPGRLNPRRESAVQHFQQRLRGDYAAVA